MNDPIRSVLVATDFSPTARAGVDWAMEIARDHGARIRLVHGLLLANRMTDYVPAPPDFTEALQSAAAARLEEVCDLVRQAGIEVSSDLRLGLPSQAILEAAREDGADLLVIGTRGLTGVSHLLLGSTAERVVQHADCPVLSVHPGDHEQHRRIRTVLVPTDFSRDAESATAAAMQLLGDDIEGARIVLLNAYHLPFEYTAYGTIPTSVDYTRDVEGVAQERLASIAAKLGADGLQVETRAIEGYPPEVIVDEAERSGVDLIAMGTHGRTGLAHLFLGSTAERVVQSADCPVLTVRRRQD
jgi:nucleotide-binding universal stress UspA family protein